nr:transposase (putative), gypsy type [Tanacetum cinerariifolium]
MVAVRRSNSSRICERAAKLDARIADVRHDMDNDLYPHMLTAIVERRWVIGHDFCFAVHQCASSAECRSALGKVISMAINKGIQQGLEAGVVHGKAGRSLTQIEAYNPEVTVPIYSESSSIDHEMLLSDVIPAIRGPAALKGLCPPSSSTLGRASSSEPPHDSSLGIVDYQAHDNLFDTSFLDGAGEKFLQCNLCVAACGCALAFVGDIFM